jgi:hypothetical protein
MEVDNHLEIFFTTSTVSDLADFLQNFLKAAVYQDTFSVTSALA